MAFATKERERQYMKEYRAMSGKVISSERRKKYGCFYCADRKECNHNEPCRYAEVLDQYKSYADYDAAISKRFVDLWGWKF